MITEVNVTVKRDGVEHYYALAASDDGASISPTDVFSVVDWLRQFQRQELELIHDSDTHSTGEVAVGEVVSDDEVHRYEETDPTLKIR